MFTSLTGLRAYRILEWVSSIIINNGGFMYYKAKAFFNNLDVS